MNGNPPLLVLMIEDRPTDAELIASELGRQEYQVKFRRVNTASGLEAALAAQSWDIILTDYRLQDFSATEALQILQRSSRDIPLIIVSGSVGEETAIEALRRGASDYIHKRNLARLGPAVHRELVERGHRAARRAAEQRLRLSEERFRFLVEAVPEMIWTADRDGRIEYGNARMQAFAGPISVGMGLRLPDWVPLLHPEDAGPSREAWKRANETGGAYEFECRFQRAADGAFRWYLVRALPLRDDSGLVIQWFGTGTDINDQKDAEAAQRFLADIGPILSASLDYRATLEKLACLAVRKFGGGCAVHLRGEQGKIELVTSAQLEPGIPLDPAQVIRSGTPELVAENAGPGLQSYLSVPLIARGRSFGAITFVSATTRYSESDLKLAEDLARRTALAVDNAMLYDEAKGAIQARDEFLSVASHELKTPLTSLQLRLQVALRNLERDIETAQATLPVPESRDFARISNYLRVCDIQSKRLAKLIDELLDLTRIRAGKLVLHPERVHVAGLVKEVVARLDPQLRQSRVPVQIEADPACEAYWDRTRVEQMLTNLLSNAIKYGLGNPIVVRAMTDVTRDLIHFEVQDYGMGIAPEHQSRIFERFERAISSTNISGLGLGLYIARQIVEAHGGTIQVRSELGKGSLFIVEIPTRLSLLAAA